MQIMKHSTILTLLKIGDNMYKKVLTVLAATAIVVLLTNIWDMENIITLVLIQTTYLYMITFNKE